MKRLAACLLACVLGACVATPASADQPNFTPGCFGGNVADNAQDGGLALGQNPLLDARLDAIHRACDRRHDVAIARHKLEHGH